MKWLGGPRDGHEVLGEPAGNTFKLWHEDSADPAQQLEPHHPPALDAIGAQQQRALFAKAHLKFEEGKLAKMEIASAHPHVLGSQRPSRVPWTLMLIGLVNVVLVLGVFGWLVASNDRAPRVNHPTPPRGASGRPLAVLELPPPEPRAGRGRVRP